MKGQTAMEYLMTYGWVLLVIIIVFFFLYWMGIIEIDVSILENKMVRSFLVAVIVTLIILLILYLVMYKPEEEVDKEIEED